MNMPSKHNGAEVHTAKLEPSIISAAKPGAAPAATPPTPAPATVVPPAAATAAKGDDDKMSQPAKQS